MEARYPSPGATGDIDEWVVLLEFARPGTERSFLVPEVEALVGHLREWHPTALCHPDRYAIHLQIPARGPDQALSWAFAYHREAAQAAGLPAAPLVRAEVFTVDEMERSGVERHRTTPLDTGLDREQLVYKKLYTVTRRLLAATTAAEVTDIVIDFVTSVGGRVEPGAALHLAGTIDVDLGLQPPCHASAEATSVTGLILEQWLPPLIIDAESTVARIRTHL